MSVFEVLCSLLNRNEDIAEFQWQLYLLSQVLIGYFDYFDFFFNFGPFLNIGNNLIFYLNLVGELSR